MATVIGTIKHRHQSTLPPGGHDVDVPEWNDSLVVSGGSDGQYAVRDTSKTDGWGWASLGDLSVTTVTATGAVNGGSLSSSTTWTVAGTSTLAAVNATTVTASGAVSAAGLSSSTTLAVTGASTLAAVSATTVTASGAISGGSLASSTTVVAAGDVSGGALTTTGAVNAATVTASGANSGWPR